ncbi:MAG: hypothetical protein ACKPGT_29430 [Microcystis sp.]|jgi:hypothetical protein|uniref:Uncharacterized protein n=2 Tax=Microcystis TaxID=1125 RepID=A0A841URT4_MICAE|nr:MULTISPECIES: hypothetical protein [Microcystis]MCA2541607.1 hypothetical protein [Microcystis sp. M54BS1]MCA2595144.1 hypothetical protein [Microcystis sp. M38BS1]MCA2608933.1 hypothetical protein [Microcystis sp. M27BS1]NCS30208.1 hypothetical protein [Microcystis aeruginosa F13-15]AKV71176.1 hypothetical protein VL20_6448 [Microcystis panniformis FACHB-1757]
MNAQKIQALFKVQRKTMPQKLFWLMVVISLLISLEYQSVQASVVDANFRFPSSSNSYIALAKGSSPSMKPDSLNSPLLAQSTSTQPSNNGQQNFGQQVVYLIAGLFLSWFLLFLFGPFLFLFGVVLIAIGLFNANPPLIGAGFVYVALGMAGVWLRGGN